MIVYEKLNVKIAVLLGSKNLRNDLNTRDAGLAANAQQHSVVNFLAFKPSANQIRICFKWINFIANLFA